MATDRNSALIPLLLLVAGEMIASAFKPPGIVPPVRGKISSPFGNRKSPVTGEREHHNGVDIAVPDKTPVASIASGKVLNVYRSEVGGLQIVISHDNGMISGYAHLSKSLVKIGDKVSKGETVALSGNSGRVAGYHLHFSLRNKKGEYIDPKKKIRF